MRESSSIIVEDIISGSIGEELGIKKGDKIFAVNSYPTKDIIDLIFYGNEGIFSLNISRDQKNFSLTIPKGPLPSELGISFAPFKIKTCRNKCIFCFVMQLPKGLRKTLYIKDEDYRMSFLYGNFITATNLTKKDKERIVEQKLSPLYLSVHCTDREIRNKMLGNPNAPDILKDIAFFAKNRIYMHIQIVLCPGYNDGIHLTKTISDLYRYYPSVASIAVVPVGLTVHRKKNLMPVTKEDAIKTIEIIEKFQNRFKRRHGEHIVFASDEMYLKAGKPSPPLEHYDQLPQIENGVGMVPYFLYRAKQIKLTDKSFSKSKRFVTITGTSFFPYLKAFVDNLNKAGAKINLFDVKNTFFGETITVAGLLTGRDIIKTLSDNLDGDNILLIPDVMVKENENIFLDNVSKQDIEKALGIPAFIIKSTPDGLVEAITSI
ncbi:MAG: DUF512 domain-containing protein [Thermodesulfovibrionales bacterium]|nr:DUF512 domain-containing protein [Thermodesulfovibrionales bacterium]